MGRDFDQVRSIVWKGDPGKAMADLIAGALAEKGIAAVRVAGEAELPSGVPARVWGSVEEFRVNFKRVGTLKVEAEAGTTLKIHGAGPAAPAGGGSTGSSTHRVPDLLPPPAGAPPPPFLPRRFLVPWVKTFAAGRPLRIARWERGGRAEGFLFRCRRAESEGWELLGSDRVSDSLDAVVAAGMEGEFWAELLRSPPEMLAEGPLHLPTVVEGSPSLSLLPGICGERGIAFFAEEADRSPFLRLPESFDDYLGQLDKKERHELRRKLRRAGEAEPRLSFRVTGTAEELSRDFPSFLELHRRSHPEKRRFMDDRMAEFFREVAQGFFSAGWLRLAFLSGAGGDIASAFQIETDRALLLYNSGFDH